MLDLGMRILEEARDYKTQNEMPEIADLEYGVDIPKLV